VVHGPAGSTENGPSVWLRSRRHRPTSTSGASRRAAAGPGKKTTGYNKRAKVEAAIGRWKQVIGDRLRSRVDERRVTEVSVVVHVLNRMLVLGRPNYVRVV
jgi:hypothetical protein